MATTKTDGGESPRRYRAPSPPSNNALAQLEFVKALKRLGFDPDTLDDSIAEKEGRRMEGAYIDWCTLKTGRTLEDGSVERCDPPGMTYEEAKEWARGAWYLHHAAGRPFEGGSAEVFVFRRNHWQAALQEDLRNRELRAQVRKPLRPIAVVDTAGDEPAEPVDPEGVIVPLDQHPGLPDAVWQALGKLTEEDQHVVLRDLLQREVRQSEVVMAAQANYGLGAADARPFVPERRGPRGDSSLERALHLGAMVKYLVGRGLPRGRNLATDRHESASDAVAYGAGRSFSAVCDAWESFSFIESNIEGRQDCKWAEVFQAWQEWNRNRRGGDKKKRTP